MSPAAAPSPSQSLAHKPSILSLFRSLSDPVRDYETSLDKYPWLARDSDDPRQPLDPSRTSPGRPPSPPPRPASPYDMEHRPWDPLTRDGLHHHHGQHPGHISLSSLEQGSVPPSRHGEPERFPSLSSSDKTEQEMAHEVDPDLVTWDAPDDPANPLNWSRRAKWTSTILVSCFTFISPIASTMLSPALPDMGREFGTSGFETYLIMSIFLLAYAVGPFILAPLSEMYGRVVVLQSANMVFLIFNTVCGFSKTKTQIMLFRFLSGLGGAAPQAMGSGVLSDCWTAEERGGATAIYSLAPFLGPAIGPIAGGYLTQYMNWRWIFWVVSMADAFVQVLAFVWLPETYRPKILAKKARKLRKLTGNQNLHTEAEAKGQTWESLFMKSIARPFIMLTTQLTIQITGLYRAYLYGLMYLVLASFPMVWEEKYNQDPGRASLNYISLGVGFVIGLQISGPMLDWVYRRLKVKYNSPGRPEFRVPLMLPTALVAPGGLLLYGLSADYQLHWIVPNIGAAIFAMGLILSFQCAQTYIVDSYEKFTASATGAAAFMRTMAGFGFPLFAPQLFDALGIAGGNGLLAGVAAVICLVVPILLWRYGEWIRRKSPYCAG